MRDIMNDQINPPLRSVPLLSVCRFQRHAVQEKPHACGALLQSGSSPDGAAVEPSADCGSAVAGKDPGRQR